MSYLRRAALDEVCDHVACGIEIQPSLRHPECTILPLGLFLVDFEACCMYAVPDSSIYALVDSDASCPAAIRYLLSLPRAYVHQNHLDTAISRSGSTFEFKWCATAASPCQTIAIICER